MIGAFTGSAFDCAKQPQDIAGKAISVHDWE
jgi:hypothetical protein